MWFIIIMCGSISPSPFNHSAPFASVSPSPGLSSKWWQGIKGRNPQEEFRIMYCWRYEGEMVEEWRRWEAKKTFFTKGGIGWWWHTISSPPTLLLFFCWREFRRWCSICNSKLPEENKDNATKSVLYVLLPIIFLSRTENSLKNDEEENTRFEKKSRKMFR